MSARTDSLTASEAVYGLLGWLTCRTEPVTFGENHEASTAAELADQFCRANDLAPPRDDFHTRLRHPTAEGER